MNKKIVAIVIIVECVLAILLVSFWGKIIEALHPSVITTEVVFTDKDGNIYEDDSIIEIELTDSNRGYQLYWKVSPDNATNQTVRFTTDQDKSYVEVSENGLVTFYEDVTVKIIITTLDGSEQSASIYLSPKQDDIGGDVEI